MVAFMMCRVGGTYLLTAEFKYFSLNELRYSLHISYENERKENENEILRCSESTELNWR